MMRSMFSGVSGLKTHQTKMDVVGNNIANVNTVGYKRSTVTFNEMLNQQIRGASAPSTSFFGGTNPMQVGLGVTVGSIDVVHSPGSPQSTGRSMDMSIEGEGYFVVGLGADNYYTRAGNFGFDSENNLVASNGMKVKGWTSAIDSDNKFSLDTSQAISPINLTALSTSQIMQATTSVGLGVNLDSRLAATEASSPAKISGDYIAANGNLNLLVDGHAVTVSLSDTDDIDEAITKINSAINSVLASTDVNYATKEGLGKITIAGATIGTGGSLEILSSSTAAIGLPISSAKGITTTKKYTSPTVTGSDLNAATSSAPVRINIGEGVIVDGEFTISDGTKTIKLDDTNKDSWELDPSSGLLILKGDFGGGWDTSVDTGKIQVNYKKADYQTSMKVYDNQGGAHDFTVSYMKKDSNQWVANYAIDGDVIDFGGGNFTKTMIYKTNGQIDENISQNAQFELPYSFAAGSGLDPLSINVDLTNMIQVANENSTLSNIQNGFSPGSLQRISVNQTGQIIGTFSNGENIELAQVALATFSNTSGLSKVGDTLFVESRNSGLPEFGAPGTAGKGSVKPEALEMSNVDLSQEFVDMIITQRGFQANSRIITTSDEMLQELVNLKR